MPGGPKWIIKIRNRSISLNSFTNIFCRDKCPPSGVSVSLSLFSLTHDFLAVFSPLRTVDYFMSKWSHYKNPRLLTTSSDARTHCSAIGGGEGVTCHIFGGEGGGAVTFLYLLTTEHISETSQWLSLSHLHWNYKKISFGARHSSFQVPFLLKLSLHFTGSFCISPFHSDFPYICRHFFLRSLFFSPQKKTGGGVDKASAPPSVPTGPSAHHQRCASEADGASVPESRCHGGLGCGRRLREGTRSGP